MNSSLEIQILQHVFANHDLLKEALTHPSSTKARNSQKLDSPNYERLEFLGDTVLGLVIAELLLELFPAEREGALAKRHAGLVCGETLTKIARTIGLGEYMVLSASEEASGGRENDANLENTLEALLGALYLDGGLPAAKPFILRYWSDLARDMKEPPKDPKTHLQELVQSSGKPIPVYTMIANEGPDHAPVFTMEVQIEGYPPMQGTGTSKRLAEREAAARMLEIVCSS
jgi:ribonuclease-3